MEVIAKLKQSAVNQTNGQHHWNA